MVLFAIIFQLLMTAIGMYGTVKVELCPMILNAFVCCSFLGAFIIYLMIDTLFSSDADSESLADTSVMILLSFPFIIIFAIGCHSMYLTNMLFDEFKLRK